MKWLLIALFSINTAYAAPSLLGICHKDFPCKQVNNLYQGLNQVELSWLETTFNEQCPCVDSLLNDPRRKIIRAHLIQSPCMRNKRCGRYEALWGYTAASGSRAALNPNSRLRKRFNKVVSQFKARVTGKELTCYVSPCLECDLYEPARKVLASVVSAALPSCNIVDNPYRRKCLPGYTCEQHGVNPKLTAPCIVDLDGIDGSTVDIKAWVARYKHCDLTYYWEPWMNCIRGKFVDPRSRNCKYPASTFEGTKGVLCQYFYQSSDICLP
jgi:hypothetical protein